MDTLIDLDVEYIYELKIYKRQAEAFTIRKGQGFTVKGKEVTVSDIYRDKNYLQLYGVRRYLIEVQFVESGDKIIWKCFEGVDVEVTYDIV